jgi:hypothetical protein
VGARETVQGTLSLLGIGILFRVVLFIALVADHWGENEDALFATPDEAAKRVPSAKARARPHSFAEHIQVVNGKIVSIRAVTVTLARCLAAQRLRPDLRTSRFVSGWSPNRKLEDCR